MAEEDPCARLARLRKARDALILGEAVTETRFGEDAVKFSKADITILDREIAEASVACDRAMGVTPTRRPRRYAMGVRFRSY